MAQMIVGGRQGRRPVRPWWRSSPPSFFGFNLFSMGPGTLVLAFLTLLWFAYSIGLFILGIIFRLGTRIQALAWGLVLIFQPLTAAFYPLSVMPPVMQAIALPVPADVRVRGGPRRAQHTRSDVGVGRHRQPGERDLFRAVGVVLPVHVPPLARDGPVRAQRGIAPR